LCSLAPTDGPPHESARRLSGQGGQLRKEPGSSLDLIDPDHDQAGGCDMVCSSHIVRPAQLKRERFAVLAKLGQHNQRQTQAHRNLRYGIEEFSAFGK